jgi:hypothetical protein
MLLMLFDVVDVSHFERVAHSGRVPSRRVVHILEETCKVLPFSASFAITYDELRTTGGLKPCHKHGLLWNSCSR